MVDLGCFEDLWEVCGRVQVMSFTAGYIHPLPPYPDLEVDQAGHNEVYVRAPRTTHLSALPFPG